MGVMKGFKAYIETNKYWEKNIKYIILFLYIFIFLLIFNHFFRGKSVYFMKKIVVKTTLINTCLKSTARES